MADTLATPFTAAWSEVGRVAPAVTAHPRITIATTALAVAGGFAYYSRSALVWAAVIHQGSLCNASCCYVAEDGKGARCRTTLGHA